MIGVWIIVAACTVLLPDAGLAQSDTAGSSDPIHVTGRVVDSINLALPGATVSLIAVGTDAPKLEVLTNEGGGFAFNSVSPGAYVLRFDAPGYLSRKIRLTMATTPHDVHVGLIALEIGEIKGGPLVVNKGPQKEKPVTVCESLSDLKKFSGKPIAIVGRIECGASLIDHVCFLAEDRCDQPVRTDGYTWPTKVLILNYWEEGIPKPPSTMPEIDQGALAKKLLLVGKSTTLGLHKELQFRAEGNTIRFSHWADLKDQWGIAYGVVFTAPNLKKDGCGDKLGCEGFYGAPIALITLPDAPRPFIAGKTRKR